MLASIYNAATQHLFRNIIRRLEEEGAEIKADAEAKREEANESYRAKCASAARLYKDMRLAANKLKRASAETLVGVATKHVADCVAKAKATKCESMQATFDKCKKECDKKMAEMLQFEKSVKKMKNIKRAREEEVADEAIAAFVRASE